jgi:hypothetical protein
LSPCNELTDELLGNYYITVRGTNQYSDGIPARFSITIDRTGGVEKRQINPNEIALLYATPFKVDPPLCPASNPSDINSCAQCNDPTTVPNTYSVKPVIWNYPLDGAEFIGDVEVSLSLDLGAETTYELTGARLNVLTEFPDFCDDSRVPQRCTVSTFSPLTCPIIIDRCTYANFRQIYFWIDNLNFRADGADVNTFNSPIQADQINLAKLTLTQKT